MFRLILAIILLVIIYWTARSIWEDLKKGLGKRRPKSPSSPPPRVTDRLVRDPVCGVYCPRSSAYTAIWKGKVYYFCSEECRQKFLAEKGSAASSAG